MTPESKKIYEDALSMPREERVDLAKRLIDSVEEQECDELEISDAWKHEITRRIEAVERGEMKLIPGDEVFKSLRARQLNEN